MQFSSLHSAWIYTLNYILHDGNRKSNLKKILPLDASPSWCNPQSPSKLHCVYSILTPWHLFCFVLLTSSLYTTGIPLLLWYLFLMLFLGDHPQAQTQLHPLLVLGKTMLMPKRRSKIFSPIMMQMKLDIGGRASCDVTSERLVLNYMVGRSLG